MDTSMIPEYARGATPEEVWAVLRENAEQQKKTDRMFQETKQLFKETGERMKENARMFEETKQLFKETDERMKDTDERMKETDRRMKETDKRMGFLSNRFGEMAEHLVAPGIYERFNEMGYHFGARSLGGQLIEDEDGKTQTEIDIVLENNDTIMAVEVKAKPKLKHIEEHIKRLEILRDYRRKFNDPRQVEGAIAGAIFGIEEKKATIEAGLYVVEQSGDTMKIEVPDGFIPRRW